MDKRFEEIIVEMADNIIRCPHDRCSACAKSADVIKDCSHDLQKEIDRLKAELEDLHSGKRGACFACEPVGELNKKLEAELEEARGVIATFTDQKSLAFPKGEMLRMHGGCGNGQFICEYNFETIKRARAFNDKYKRG